MNLVRKLELWKPGNLLQIMQLDEVREGEPQPKLPNPKAHTPNCQHIRSCAGICLPWSQL